MNYYEVTLKDYTHLIPTCILHTTHGIYTLSFVENGIFTPSIRVFPIDYTYTLYYLEVDHIKIKLTCTCFKDVLEILMSYLLQSKVYITYMRVP